MFKHSFYEATQVLSVVPIFTVILYRFLFYRWQLFCLEGIYSGILAVPGTITALVDLRYWLRQWKLYILFANFHVRASKCKLIRKLLDIADKYLHATMREKMVIFQCDAILQAHCHWQPLMFLYFRPSTNSLIS